MTKIAGCTLRPANRWQDDKFLLALRLATMGPHFARQGRTLSEAEHRRRIDHRFDVASIIEREGVPVGLLKVVRDGGSWTLEQIQIAPAEQGRGLGAAVLRALIDEAAQAGASIELGVLKGNPARGLYERLGFRVVAESDDDVTMRLEP